MSSSAPKKKTVYEQWLEIPEHFLAEIVKGELHSSPRPSPKLARASSILGGNLMGPFDQGNGGPGGWWILDEPEIHLESNILVPDIAGWRRERMPQIPDEAFFSVVPDWIGEVISPSSAVLDRTKKMPFYASQGVKYFWLVDPIIRILEIYQNGQKIWKLLYSFANDDKVRAAPFDAIEIDLSTLWT